MIVFAYVVIFSLPLQCWQNISDWRLIFRFASPFSYCGGGRWFLLWLGWTLIETCVWRFPSGAYSWGALTAGLIGGTHVVRGADIATSMSLCVVEVCKVFVQPVANAQGISCTGGPTCTGNVLPKTRGILNWRNEKSYTSLSQALHALREVKIGKGEVGWLDGESITYISIRSCTNPSLGWSRWTAWNHLRRWQRINRVRYYLWTRLRRT